MQNPRRKLDDKCLYLPCVRFCSCLCNQVCSRVSGALLLTSRTLSLSFLTNNSSSDSKAFFTFHCVLRLPNSSTPCFPFFDAKAWPQSQTDLFTVTCTTVLHCGHTFLRRIDLLGQAGPIALRCMHYGVTLWAYLSQTHRPIALRCMHYGITLWAYLSEPLVKDSHKRLTGLSSTEKPQYRYVITHYRYVCVTER